MNELPDQSSFFDAGIRFTCTQCGHCCTGSPGQVRVTPEEINAIANATRKPADEFLKVGGTMLLEKPNGDCVFHENGCTIYAMRPTQCRTYPFWFRNLRSEESWAKARAECPGIGEGRLYSKKEILDLITL